MLADREHVEAIAIMRALLSNNPVERAEGQHAAGIWLVENHPLPETYANAARDAAWVQANGVPRFGGSDARAR